MARRIIVPLLIIAALAAPQILRGERPADNAGIDWVTIPGGSFTMGSDNWTDARPAHRVTVRSFQLARSPVTYKQYQACVRAGICSPATGCRTADAFKGDDFPVVCVDWNQAGAFSKWAGGRLPTEAEWEYAARSAGKNWKYPWGNESATCSRAVINFSGYTNDEAGGCGHLGPWPVCSKPAGKTRQGLCDMAGNVWEWVQDVYHDNYVGAPEDGTAWEYPNDRFRVKRGGSWEYDGRYALTFNRDARTPEYHGNSLGFRPARSAR